MITHGSLFDGMGGWILAARRAGIQTLWSSEIEPAPMAVTKLHFPDVKQLGDITKLDGKCLPPVDIITFSSPCQDLSVAGQREGLKGERSGLFRTAVKLIHAMRDATGGKYPKCCVWENVPGAFSSNHGRDFQTVLEEIAEACVPVPQSGRWSKSGMVRGGRACITWRTLDAKYWGVPQRRKRIFLVGDFTGGGGLAEILFKSESMQGNPGAGGEESKDAQSHSESGDRETGVQCINDQGGAYINQTEDYCGTLRAQANHPPIVKDECHLLYRDCVGTLNGMPGGGGSLQGARESKLVLENEKCFAEKRYGEYKEDTIAATCKESGGSIHGGGETLVVSKGNRGA